MFSVLEQEMYSVFIAALGVVAILFTIMCLVAYLTGDRPRLRAETRRAAGEHKRPM